MSAEMEVAEEAADGAVSRRMVRSTDTGVDQGSTSCAGAVKVCQVPSMMKALCGCSVGKWAWTSDIPRPASFPATRNAACW